MHGGKTGKEEWLTPPYIINQLGEFDLDPCAPINRPWDTAKHHYTIEDDGLKQPWRGRVWLNPPYGNKTGEWMRKMAEHSNGIALTFARTDTEWFQKYVFMYGHAILFIKGRIQFYHANGHRSLTSAGAPSCLIAYGKVNVDCLYDNNIRSTRIILPNGERD
jgi:hypothetical protein